MEDSNIIVVVLTASALAENETFVVAVVVTTTEGFSEFMENYDADLDVLVAQIPFDGNIYCCYSFPMFVLVLHERLLILVFVVVFIYLFIIMTSMNTLFTGLQKNLKIYNICVSVLV